MRYILLSFLFIACKEVEMEVIEKEKVVYNESIEVFEGRHYFENGGSIEMYNDFNNQVTTLSSTLLFPNSNNTLASFTFPALSKHDILNGKIKSALITMTGVQASNFVGNIQGNASNGVQLSNIATYRYQVTLEMINSKLNVTLEIQQLSGVLYNTVYLKTIESL